MKNLEDESFDTMFLDDWHHHYQRLEAYHKQNGNGHEPGLGAIDEDLLKWINIQSKIKNRLPATLKEKLSDLNFDIYEKGNFWEARYQQLARFFKKNGHTNLPDEEAYEALKDWLLRQIQGKNYLSESQFQRLDQLGVDWELVLTRDQRWAQMYFRLKEFRQAFGHCQVPQNWESDKSLANWVRVQRRLHSINKLRPERESKLQELGFIWHIQTVYDAQWQHYYQELKAFYEAQGHCRVPGKNKHLTSWIENQRTAQKNKLLLPERERQLNEIGFIWSFKDLKKSYWEEKYKQLSAFRKKHGHCFVPVNYKEDKSLGHWVATQRNLEAHNRLEEAKKKKLDRLGFVWRTQTQVQLKSVYDSQWTLQFERLKIYQQVYGTCQVSLKINPVLQRWTRWQRTLFYEGRLSEERIARLDEIGFPWNVQEGYWMKMYNALRGFREQFGHTRVPYQWPPNRQLAAWIYRQKLTKPELPPQKIELLDKLGFDWGLKRKVVVSWDDMYNRLLKFQQQHGHTRVPVKWPQDLKLGKWVSRMRQEKQKLSAERVALLDRIGFSWLTNWSKTKTPASE